MVPKKEYFYLMRARGVDREILDIMGDDVLGLARLPYNWASGAVIDSVSYEPITKAQFETYQEFEITTEIPFDVNWRWARLL